MKTLLKFAFGFAFGFALVSQAFAFVAYDNYVPSTVPVGTYDTSIRISNYWSAHDVLMIGNSNGLCLDSLCTMPLTSGNIYVQKIAGETYPAEFTNGNTIFSLNTSGSKEILGISVVKGKYKIDTNFSTTFYACLYDSLLGVETSSTTRFYLGGVSNDENFICDPYLNGYENVNLNNTVVPPVQPVSIYGQLDCSTKLVNTLSGATWYNMGELAYNFNKSYTGVIWQQFTDVNTGQITDADNIRFTLVNDIGSDMPVGSIAWSGSTTNAYLSGDGELQIRATRDNAPLAFNTVQFGGIASGGNSVRVRYQYLNGDYHEGISYLSGSILTISTPQLSKGVFVSNLGRFRGIRVGVAQQETKTFCGIAGSSCGWKMVGTENSCVPIQLSGIQLSSGGCYITSSTSVYGSGACVPTVNGSGAIIPHTVLGQSSVYYNSSGAIVGIVNTGQIPDISFYDQVFNCGFDYENDSWYTTVAKALTCPVNVVKNLFFTSYTSVKEVSEGFQKIQNAVSQISTATGVTQNDSDTGMNPIFSSLKDKTDFIKNNDRSYVGKMVQFLYWAMIVMTILMLLGIIVYLLKKK